MIIVFGSLNVDIVMPVENFPKPRETILCTTDYLSNTGGKGSNQAVAAAKLGAKVAFVGKVGDDAFGRRSVNNLKNHGIWTSGIGISDRPTGCATIAVDKQGANFVISAPGANLDATADQLPDEVFNKDNILLTQLNMNPAETFTVLKRAKAHHCTTILDASPAGQLKAEVLESIDYIIMNELESLQLAQGFNITETHPKDLAPILSKMGNLTCIITREEKGAVAARDGVLYAVAALPIEPVDTTGAGDVFCGIFAACLQEDMSWLKALHHASVGASLACLEFGAQSGLPSLEEIQANLSQIAPPYQVS